ncbi:hypothetical protein AGMMS49949_04710 [Alphaproteobacteria bacterium]|nr:hypothetical protein AGMMS49949_04710 [Alphaproteobacteria bacterium]GHS97165.1 hypothetical protein AGMMS50296_3910 [Alphaproteobacteria bacterium]
MLKKKCLEKRRLCLGFCAAAALFFVGCSGTKIKGKRELLITSLSEISVDKNLASTPFSLPACKNKKQWLQNQGGAAHEVGHLCLDAAGVKWLGRVSVGHAGGKQSLISNIVSYDGVLFVGTTQGNVVAVAALAGKGVASAPRVLWKTALATKIEDPSKIGGLAFLPGAGVVASAATGEVALLDAQTGKVKKTQNLECALRSAPTLSKNRIFIQGNNNALFGLDHQLNLLWQHCDPPENVLFLGNGAPAVDRDSVVAVYSTGEYKAYDEASGSELWFDFMTASSQDDTAANVLHIYASPVIAGNLVFVLGHNGHLSANALHSGARVWSVPFSGIHTPALAGNWLFALDNEGAAFCFEKTTGKLRWRSALPENKAKKRPKNWTAPLVLGGHVVVVTNSGDLVFFDAKDGRVVQILPSRVNNPSAAIVVDKVLYVLSSDGYLYAFG